MILTSLSLTHKRDVYNEVGIVIVSLFGTQYSTLFTHEQIIGYSNIS